MNINSNGEWSCEDCDTELICNDYGWYCPKCNKENKDEKETTGV